MEMNLLQLDRTSIALPMLRFYKHLWWSDESSFWTTIKSVQKWELFNLSFLHGKL